MINYLSIEKYIVIFFALLIPFDYIGRGLYNIDLVLILVLFIILLIGNRDIYKKVYTKITFLILVILFYSFALIINLINPTLNITPNVKLLFTLLAFLFIVTYIFKNSEQFSLNYILFEKVLFYAVSLISLFLLISFLINIDIFESIRTSSIVNYGHWRFHSKQNLIAMCIPFLINYYFSNKNKTNLILLVIIILGTFSAQGRTAIITLTTGIFIYVIYDVISRKCFNIKNILIMLLFILFSISFVLYMSGSSFEKLQFHNSGRYEGWLVFIDYIKEGNTLFGYGIEGSYNIYKSGILKFSHPHNSFIEVLFSLGVIGFSLFLILLFIYIYTIFKLDNKTFNKHVAYSFLFSLLLMQQGIGTIWGANFVVPTVLLMFLSINVKKTV